MLPFLLTLACMPERESIEGDAAGECDDGVDNDQDGLADCEDDGCAAAAACTGSLADSGFIDQDADADGDGFTPADGDCDDDDADVNPDAQETCNDVDDDCNGQVDDVDAGTLYFEDADGDDYGDPDSTTYGCDTAPDGYVDNDLDCDDADQDVNPDGTESDWDGVDQDCDGVDVDLAACVAQGVADATDWVSWWEYDVDDQSADYWGFAGYDLYFQTLYVDADEHELQQDDVDPLWFDVQVQSLQALNHVDDPFWLDAYFDTTYYYCDGYIDWVEVPYDGGIEVFVSDGGTVTATVDLASRWDGYVQDDIVLWNYATGGTCDVTTIDTMLSYGGYDILSFFDNGFTESADDIGAELEDEIAWWINNNCTDWGGGGG